jgi:elongation factor P
MVQSNNITPGMVISISGKLYRVESSVKVSVPKGAPFIKTKLRDLTTLNVVEKSFKLNQDLKDVALEERRLEFLYLEGKDYLFLDIADLEQLLIPAGIIGDQANYLKEGVELKASLFGEEIFAVELPQFLELMVARVDMPTKAAAANGGGRMAQLETGARIEVPPFIEVGDIIKVDTKTGDYIQRV